MPGGYSNNVSVRGWDAENFTGPLVGGSTGPFASGGVIFMPTGSNNVHDPVTWLDGWRPGADITVRVSMAPSAFGAGGWVAWARWSGGYLGQTMVDFSGGGSFDVVLPAAAITEDLRGLWVYSGDAADGHVFTLESTIGGALEEGTSTLALSVSVYNVSALSLSVDVFSKSTLGLEVAVNGAATFAAGHGIRWSPLVELDGVDVSSRLTGQMSITAAEDSARLASVTLVLASSAALATLENAAITIGVQVVTGTGSAFYRIFTGRVEQVSDLYPAAQTVTLSCRDGWQERQAACASAADVQALFSGLATLAPKIQPWNAEVPDPVSYFNELLATLPGATFIDRNGLWRVSPWAIGAPAVTFTADDVFDGTLVVSKRPRAELPGAYVGTLKHRHPRLHSAELTLYWTGPTYTDFVVYGVPPLTKAVAQSALDGLGEWHIKGKATLNSPIPGSYAVGVGGGTVYYIISPESAPFLCASLTATMYRRWFQETETSYTFTITMPGGSDRDQIITGNIESTFVSGDWENAPKTDSGLDLWVANGPAPVVTPTGYEALPLPHPPANAAIDHWADIVQGDLDACAAALVAKVVRLAAAALRRDTVKFTRPIDPRHELGTVIGIVVDGVTATGQIVEVDYQLDLDSGLAETTYTLACPSGGSGATTSSASVTAPAVAVTHALSAPTLSNHFGGKVGNTMTPNPDLLQGFLCNLLPTAAAYDGAVPIYQEQFRLIMPSISAPHRDGLEQAGTLAATYNISGGSLAISF